MPFAVGTVITVTVNSKSQPAEIVATHRLPAITIIIFQVSSSPFVYFLVVCIESSVPT
jgi:hypothetical protein